MVSAASSPPFLFSELTFSDLLDVRTAAAKADPSRDADELVRRYAIDVPVMTPGAAHVVERRVTEPFIDRYNDEVPGGGLAVTVFFPFTGDVELFRVRPDSVRVPPGYARATSDAVIINFILPDQDEERLASTIARSAAELVEILGYLRADAEPANAALARRLRALCVGAD
ncbi:hypothetical protein sos41_21280 [Alphaproteobacteria bacterium SO-S41]|nr:hypothetical protein sos41_21280 [Alphaproteobacteria bacterium SO-S41]